MSKIDFNASLEADSRHITPRVVCYPHSTRFVVVSRSCQRRFYASFLRSLQRIDAHTISRSNYQVYKHTRKIDRRRMARKTAFKRMWLFINNMLKVIHFGGDVCKYEPIPENNCTFVIWKN